MLKNCPFTIVKTLIFCLVFTCLSKETRAQEVSDIKAVVQGELILISYSLNADDPGDEFSISIYSSHDNYTSRLQQVTGDVGEGIRMGEDRKIVWEAGKELPVDFSGDLKFKVIAELEKKDIKVESTSEITTFDSLYFTAPTDGYKIKRGRLLSIFWTGGNPNSKFKLDLYRNNKIVYNIISTSISNVGKHIWSIPDKFKPGKGYQLKLTDIRDPDNYVYSGKFKIKRKVPTILKILPVVVVGAGVYLILEETGPAPLPSPIEPN